MGEQLNGARLAALTSWRADWEGLRVVVLGLGAVGFSAADTLAELGARVTVIAGDATPDRIQLADVIGVSRVTADGDAAAAALRDAAPDVVVVSPGYRPGDAAVRAAAEAGIPIWSDADLAWRLRDKVTPAAEWVLVTGGDDVDATAELTAAMLVAGGMRAAPAGTADVPVLDAIRDPSGFDVLVVALSSRQLHWTGPGGTDTPGGSAGAEFAPLASACLTADDAVGDPDRRSDLGRVYANTRVACVYQLGEVATRELVEEAEVQEGCRAIGVGLGVPGPSDLGVVDGIVVDRAFLDERRSHALELTTLDELVAVGLGTPAGAGRVLTAAALARAAGATPGAVRDGVRMLGAA